MESELPWYAAMSAEDRSWVDLVAQAGIAAFVQWFRDPEGARAITADVFGTAPRELVRAVSLQQTVDLVRTTIAVVEEHVEELAGPDDARGSARACCSTPARSRSPPPRSTPAPPRCAARGTPGSRRWSSTRAARRGRRDVVSRGAALGWATRRRVRRDGGTLLRATRETILEEVRARRGTTGWTRLRRAGRPAWSSCSAA